MSKRLQALNRTLMWQLHTIEQQLIALDEQLESINKRIEDLERIIMESCSIPTLIHPEREISRTNFIACNQQQDTQLKLEQKTLKLQRELVFEKQIVLKTQLKLLENHQIKHQQKAESLLRLVQQNAIDERFIQRLS